MMPGENTHPGQSVSNTYNGDVDGPVIQVGSLYGDINIHAASDRGESQRDLRHRGGRHLDDHKAAASAALLLRAVQVFYADWPAPGKLPVLLGMPSRMVAEDVPIRPWAQAIDSLRQLVSRIEHQELRHRLDRVVAFLGLGAGFKRVFDKDQAFFLAQAVCDNGIEACEAFVRYRPLPELSFADDFVTDVFEPCLQPLVETATRSITDSGLRFALLPHQDNPPQT